MFNYRLKELRKNLEYTAESFAKELNVKISTLYSYENASAKPSYEFIATLRNFTKVNLDWLLFGNGEMFIKPKNTLEIKYEPCAEQLKEFGKRLNKLRIHADMITRDISMLLEMKEDRFSDLCIGKKEPTLAEIAKICENFEVTADWLMFGKE